jgi:transcriptional regulator with XRE-family HTH domain
MPLVTNKQLREAGTPEGSNSEPGAYEMLPHDYDLRSLRREAMGVKLPTRPGRWGEKRDRRQSVLAKRLGVNQGQVSRIERQEDPRLSTLEKYIEALGGRLELVAVFEDPDEPGQFWGHRLQRR